MPTWKELSKDQEIHVQQNSKPLKEEKGYYADFSQAEMIISIM